MVEFTSTLIAILVALLIVGFTVGRYDLLMVQHLIQRVMTFFALVYAFTWYIHGAPAIVVIMVYFALSAGIMFLGLIFGTFLAQRHEKNKKGRWK